MMGWARLHTAAIPALAVVQPSNRALANARSASVKEAYPNGTGFEAITAKAFQKLQLDSDNSLRSEAGIPLLTAEDSNRKVRAAADACLALVRACFNHAEVGSCRSRSNVGSRCGCGR